VAKPSDTFRWCTVVPANIVNPPTIKKDEGWLPDEQPPAGMHNWLFNGAHLWFVYLDTIEAHALTWTMLETFTKGVTITNSTAAIGLSVTGGANRDGIHAFGGAGGDKSAIIGEGSGEGYGGQFLGGPGGGPGALIKGGPGGTGALIEATGGAYGAYISSDTGTAINALAGGNDVAFKATNSNVGGTGGAIEAVSNGNNSTIEVTQNGDGYALFATKPSNSGTSTAYLSHTATSSGSTSAALEVNQGFSVANVAIKVNQGSLTFSGTQPIKTANPGQDNALHGANISKAWGSITVEGLGGGAVTITLEDGYNVATVTLDGTSGLQVNFARGMLNDKYAAIPSKEAAIPNPYVHPSTKTTAHFIIRFEEGGAVANITTLGEIRTVSFDVQARQ
jgi:hypothetical protein